MRQEIRTTPPPPTPTQKPWVTRKEDTDSHTHTPEDTCSHTQTWSASRTR